SRSLPLRRPVKRGGRVYPRRPCSSPRTLARRRRPRLVCHYPASIMLRVLLLSFSLLAGLAQAAPQAIQQSPLSLSTDQGTLQGSLLLPRSEGPLPVALLIAGSGPTDRDGNNPEGGHNDALKKLAQILARNGIASLRYDKRGVAASRAATPDEEDLSIERYVAEIGRAHV